MRRRTLTERRQADDFKRQGGEIGRPPLMPLPTTIKCKEQTKSPMQYRSHDDPQRVFFSRSEHSDGPQYDAEDSDKFELMNVTVVIYGLSGLICEKDADCKKRFQNRSKPSRKRKDAASRVSGSTISTFDPSTSEEGEMMDRFGAPTTAVVSYRKNTYSSQTALETFLPSVPLHLPMASSGLKYRYQASWPSEQSTLNRDESAMERSSFHFTRCMKQESYVPGVGAGSNYVHETLELRINMSRGTELLRLGCATLVISGEEEGEVQMNIPAKPLPQKQKKLTKNRIKTKSNKYGFFSSDLSSRFYLDENATLRVGVRVVPQDSLRMVQERERKENDLRRVLGSQELKQAAESFAEMNLRSGEAKRGLFNRESLVGSIPGEEDARSDGIFQSIFCGAMLCGAGIDRDSEKSDVPREIHAFDFGHLGVGSLVSSVSESTDGSDGSDGNLEAEFNSFPMTSALRRYA